MSAAELVAGPREVTSEEKYARFEADLCALINIHSMESGSNTPDFILAKYLVKQLMVFDGITAIKAGWAME